MVQSGETVWFSCRIADGSVRIKGIVVQVDGDSCVVGCSSDTVKSISYKFIPAEDQSVAFVKIPIGAVSTNAPTGWKKNVGGHPPVFSDASALWKKADLAAPLESSEAEMPGQSKAAGSAPASSQKLQGDLARMSADLWGGDGASSSPSEASSSDEEDATPFKTGQKHLPPGASSMRARKKASSEKSKSKSKEVDLGAMMAQGMASGASPSELMPMMMMAYMVQQQGKQDKKSRKHRRREDLLSGGSSSESSDDDEPGSRSGLKSVVALQRLHRQVQRHPQRVIRQFEKELVEELGVVEGQAWSVKDWLRKQSWGKFKGMYRAAIMDAAVYELLRSGDHQAAAAQTIQNMKAKLQSVLQGGDWTTAWVLTGLPDPLSKKEWAGSKEEMAVVTGYISSLHKLRKKVKDAQQTAAAEDQD